MRTGDRGVVKFRFLRYKEFLSVGSRLLFREGKTKGVGKIVKLCYGEENDEYVPTLAGQVVAHVETVVAVEAG